MARDRRVCVGSSICKQLSTKKYYHSGRKIKKITKINKGYFTVNMWAAERQLEINFFQKLFQNMEEIYIESLHSTGWVGIAQLE
jgi:hypothetical protein